MASTQNPAFGNQPAKRSSLDQHLIRLAGSSLYREICCACGATDAAGDRRLLKPCPGMLGVLRP
jgi:hypothetical protein